MTNLEFFEKKIKEHYKPICWILFVIVIGLFITSVFVDPCLVPLIVMINIFPCFAITKGIMTWLDEEHKEKKNENIG